MIEQPEIIVIPLLIVAALSIIFGGGYFALSVIQKQCHKMTIKRLAFNKDLEELERHLKTEAAEIPEHLRAMLSSLTGRELQFIDKRIMRHQLGFKVLDKDTENGKGIKSRLVEVDFTYHIFPSLDLCFFAIKATHHYGQPSWDGKEMHYDYPIFDERRLATIDDLEATYNSIRERIFCLNLNDACDAVKNGNCSHFVAQNYGDTLKQILSSEQAKMLEH